MCCKCRYVMENGGAFGGVNGDSGKKLNCSNKTKSYCIVIKYSQNLSDTLGSGAEQKSLSIHPDHCTGCGDRTEIMYLTIDGC